MFTAWDASLVINASTVSNTLQRSYPIAYSDAYDDFHLNGVVAISGQSASTMVLVCPLLSAPTFADFKLRVVPQGRAPPPAVINLRSQQGIVQHDV